MVTPNNIDIVNVQMGASALQYSMFPSAILVSFFSVTICVFCLFSDSSTN